MLFLAAHPRGSVMTPLPPKKDQRVSTVSDATESGPLDYLSQSPRVPESQASPLSTRVETETPSPMAGYRSRSLHAGEGVRGWGLSYKDAVSFTQSAIPSAPQYCPPGS